MSKITRSLTEISKNVDVSKLPNDSWGWETIKNSSLARIATACENMEKHLQGLTAPQEDYKSYWEAACKRENILLARIKALKGHITRLKNKSHVSKSANM